MSHAHSLGALPTSHQSAGGLRPPGSSTGETKPGACRDAALPYTDYASHLHLNAQPNLYRHAYAITDKYCFFDSHPLPHQHIHTDIHRHPLPVAHYDRHAGASPPYLHSRTDLDTHIQRRFSAALVAIVAQ